MYNRYIPQPDGSYRRNRMAEATPQPVNRPPTPAQQQTEQVPVQQQQPPKTQPEPPKQAPLPPPVKQPQPPGRQNVAAGDFLRQLLPKNLDTGDLLIIVLLLLMSADCQEDRNTALLTLVLYLFM